MKKILYIFLLISSVCFGQLGMSVGTVANSEVSADDPEITIGNTTNTGWLQDQTTSFTVSHTCTANTEMLVVSFGFTETSATTAAVSGVTYNGVAMMEAVQDHDTTTDTGVYMFYLASPTTGSAQDIVVSFGSNTLNDASLSAVDLEVATGSIDLDVIATLETGSTGDVSASITTVASHTVIIDSMIHKASNATVLTVGLGQTQVDKVDQGANTHATSYKIVDTTDTYTMDWTNSGGDEDWKSGVVSFKSLN